MSAGAKSTPGPWCVGDWQRIDKDATVSAQHGDICTVDVDDPPFHPDEVKANLHLIAAAPDLYAALAEIDAHLELCEEIEPELEKILGRVRAALAKARGES